MSMSAYAQHPGLLIGCCSSWYLDSDARFPNHEPHELEMSPDARKRFSGQMRSPPVTLSFQYGQTRFTRSGPTPAGKELLGHLK
jgi:hypothetical protein|eukprot:COSAG06_NODE_552_length_14385_cov_7.790424_3_plen_84_part_00